MPKSGSFEKLINAGSVSFIYRLKITYELTPDNDNNRDQIHLVGTIQSTSYSYNAYNLASGSKNTIQVRVDNSSGDLVLDEYPRVRFDCENLSVNTIFDKTFYVSRGTKGKRNIYVYWNFDGATGGTYNPNGYIEGNFETGQTTRRINLDPNGGNVSPLTFEVNYGDTIGKIPTPIRDGFKFLGWEYNGQLIDQNYLVQVNMKLTARWEEDSNIWVKDGTWKRAILWKKTNGKWERSKDGIN